jgi:hypothetical protein
MLSPLGRERMLGSIEGFCLRFGIEGVFELGAKGPGRRGPSPVPGRLPLLNGPSSPPGLLGPWYSPGGPLKFGPRGPGMGPLRPSSDGIWEDSPGGLRGGGAPGDFPGDLGGIGRWSGVACRAWRGSRSSLPPAVAEALPSAVAKCGCPLVRLFSSLALKPVKIGYSPLVYLL